MKEKIIKTCEQIQHETENDIIQMEGMPFDGKNVATQLGNQAAAICALAECLKRLAELIPSPSPIPIPIASPIPIPIPTEPKIDSIEMVREFHETFDHPIADKPGFVQNPVVRLNWIIEEIKEGRDAFFESDFPEYVDALCDIQYFLDGAFLESGVAGIKTQLMQEVHRRNMSKSPEKETITLTAILKENGWAPS